MKFVYLIFSYCFLSALAQSYQDFYRTFVSHKEFYCIRKYFTCLIFFSVHVFNIFSKIIFMKMLIAFISFDFGFKFYKILSKTVAISMQQWIRSVSHTIFFWKLHGTLLVLYLTVPLSYSKHVGTWIKFVKSQVSPNTKSGTLFF